MHCNMSTCDYGVHECCLKFHNVVASKSTNSAQFRCDDVNYYIKPEEIDELINLYDDDEDYWIEFIRQRGTIQTKNYSPKRKRYENPNYVCEYCGETVGINEEDHLLAHCSASFASTPVPSRDFEFVSMKFKKIRLMALYDYPP